MKAIKNTVNALQIPVGVVLAAIGPELMDGMLAFFLALAIAYHGMLSLIRRNHPEWMTFSDTE